MPLTRCSSASWSTSGLAVLPGGRRSGHASLLALAGGRCVAGGARGAAPGALALGRAVSLGGGRLGRGALGGRVGLGRTVILSRTVIPCRTVIIGGVSLSGPRPCPRYLG